MNLVTRNEAAKSVFVTVGMISYWVKKGRIKKYPIAGTSRNYLVDLDEVKKASEWKKYLIEDLPDNLITRQEAAKLLWVQNAEISYYARMGYIKKYYVFGNKYNYLVDRDEILAQVKLIPQRVEARKPILRERALRQPKDRNGKFLPLN
jgi:predicted site-specific integrase-resolvase